MGKILLLWLLIPFVLMAQPLNNRALDNHSGLSLLAEDYPNYSSTPVGLQSTEHRCYLFYPQGYLNLTENLETDEQTILSFYLTSRYSWPVISNALIEADIWLLQDQDNRIWQGNPAESDLNLLLSLEGNLQRVLLLNLDNVLLYRDSWQLLNRDSNWITEEVLTASALSLPLGSHEGKLYFFDPLSRILLLEDGRTFTLDPAPSGWIHSGIISGNQILLWDSQSKWIYTLDGFLIDQISTSATGPFLIEEDNGPLYTYHYEKAFLESSALPHPFTWNRDLENELYSVYLPQLLLEKWGEERSFLLWSLENVTRLYLKSPLNRELRDLKGDIELRLER